MEEFAKLCCHIVEDFYGSFLAHIFRQLAEHGRLTVHQIARRCRVPLCQVKSGVAALVHLRLVYHHTSSEGWSTYQANATNAYNIMRTGRLTELVNCKLGSSAASITETLASMSFATANELEARVLAKTGPANPINRPRFRVLFEQLLDLKYITAARKAHCQTLHDARQDVESDLRKHDSLPSGTGKKTKDDADAKIDVELEKRLDNSVSAPAVLLELVSGASSGKTTLSVNYSNLIIQTRNNLIADFAEKMFGRHIAQVARAACSQVDYASPRSLTMRLNDLPQDAAQGLDMDKLSSDVSDATTHKIALPNGVNGDHGPRINGAIGENRLVEHYLSVLAEGSFTFLLEDPKDQGSWNIDKSKLNKYLCDKEMYRLIGETVTEPASLRIARMLADKGKLDEKAMSDVALLNPKEVRKCLASLQRVGVLELQEVPRDPQRQPKNTFFLYFYDPERVRKVLVEKLYKAMSRTYQRLHVEREKIASTLSKLDRVDVGWEVGILPPAELEVFNDWQQKESWFMTEIYRLDDSISVLRDI